MERLADFSFEIKFIPLHMFVLILLSTIHELLPTKFLLGLITVYITGFFIILTIHRRRNNWHWPGIKKKDFLMSFFHLLIIGIFSFALTTEFNISFLLMMIILFSIVLYDIKLLYTTKAAFLSCCGENIIQDENHLPETTKPIEPKWKKIVRTIFMIYFFSIWIFGMYCIWKNNLIIKSATYQPTEERTVSIHKDNRTIVYITPEEEKLKEKYFFVYFGLILSVGLFLVICQFVLRINIHPKHNFFRTEIEKQIT